MVFRQTLVGFHQTLLLWTDSCKSTQNSYIEVLTLRMWLSLEIRPFKTWVKKDEIILVGPNPVWLASSKEEIFTQIHEHTEEREKAATHKPRKEISEEINHDGALILDISYEKFSVLLFKPVIFYYGSPRKLKHLPWQISPLVLDLL